MNVTNVSTHLGHYSADALRRFIETRLAFLTAEDHHELLRYQIEAKIVAITGTICALEAEIAQLSRRFAAKEAVGAEILRKSQLLGFKRADLVQLERDLKRHEEARDDD